MTALDLYKFISKNNIEYHYQHDGDVYLFITNYLIPEWHRLLSATIFNEDGISCFMKDGYFTFEMKDICDYFGIELREVFEPENEM